MQVQTPRGQREGKTGLGAGKSLITAHFRKGLEQADGESLVQHCPLTESHFWPSHGYGPSVGRAQGKQRTLA